jgi:hypothetical protein
LSEDFKKIDITNIKLKVSDIPGTGKEIFAFIDQPISCVEFTMKGNAYQPITHTCQPTEQMHKFISERWIQFKPSVWSQMIEDVYAEMVRLWNKEHGKGVQDE